MINLIINNPIDVHIKKICNIKKIYYSLISNSYIFDDDEKNILLFINEIINIDIWIEKLIKNYNLSNNNINSINIGFIKNIFKLTYQDIAFKAFNFMNIDFNDLYISENSDDNVSLIYKKFKFLIKNSLILFYNWCDLPDDNNSFILNYIYFNFINHLS